MTVLIFTSCPNQICTQNELARRARLEQNFIAKQTCFKNIHQSCRINKLQHEKHSPEENKLWLRIFEIKQMTYDDSITFKIFQIQFYFDL